MRKQNQPENHYTNKKRPYTTTLKINLLSSLVLSSFVFSSLVLSLLFRLLFSLCLCLCLCLCLRVVFWCVCVVRCGVWCRVHSTRLRVYVQNVPVCTGTTRTHVETCVRVVPVQTVTF